ncbi:hypothetical protein B9T07_04150 [Limnospira fusiformis CCALA 023]
MMDGICTLANDKVYDQLVALLNSIEANQGADMPVCIYPYNDNIERKGKVAEVGSHDELLAQGGKYARLYTLQFADEAERDQAIIKSSYDVRTRLNPMIGFLQLLSEDMIDEPEEREELLNESYHSATHILESLEFIEQSVKLRLSKRQESSSN